jgi:uncharacterized protein (DUF1015 family)
MATFLPFRASRYQAEAGPLGKLVSEPYDKISRDMLKGYRSSSPFNVTQVLLPAADVPHGETPPDELYQDAAARFRSWIQEGIVAQDPEPAFYLMRQTFRVPGQDQTAMRTALLGRVRLVPWERGEIMPHERTLRGPKIDRLSLLRASGVHFGQIFMLYPDASGEIAEILQSPAETLATFEHGAGIQHELLRLPAALSSGLTAAMAERRLYIADGHHRYETALAYSEERNAGPNDPAGYVLSSLVSMQDPGLVVLPTHRIVHSLPDFSAEKLLAGIEHLFQVEPAEELTTLVNGLVPRSKSLGLALKGRLYRLALRDDADLEPYFHGSPALWHDSEVALLHLAILEPLLGIDAEAMARQTYLRYAREPQPALADVEAGQAQALFLLPPTPAEYVKAIADAGVRMPQKSTDFYPKLPTGVLFYDTTREHV